MQLLHTPLYNDANLKEYYRLEDATGKNGINLGNDNAVTFLTPGKYGFCANFSGANRDLTINHNMGITSRIMSIVGWVKCVSDIGSGAWELVQTINNTNKGFAAIVYDYNGGARRLTAQQYKIGGGDVLQVIHNPVTLGTSDWWHFAMTSNGTNFFFYVNGVLAGTNTCPANGSTTVEARTNLGFNFIPPGPLSGPNTYATGALLDDVAFFDRLLTQAEVSMLARDSAGGPLFMPSGGGLGLA